ncbi:MATE family efflux transporter [Paenibacillus massiliensis]|uniref:MATE family efflux transporter n=1 Tax=Paenibacillus massiliensis TaxID=225917 RepID=UPI00037A13C0|nr:MATE family efflux transporter [Paenibacillus massiliensis]
MERTYTTMQKWKQFLYILTPILVTQISLSLMTFFDTNMSGRFSPADLAGVAVGVSLWNPVQTGLSGILLAVTPVVAQLIGKQRKDRVSFYVIQALWLSIIIAIAVLLLGLLGLEPIIQAMNLEERVAYVAIYYLVTLAFGIVPFFGYTVLRSFMDALGQTRITMMITLASLPINIVLNYLLIYGKLGFPELGGIGAGVATAFTYWICFLLSFILVHRHRSFAEYGIFRSWQGFSFSAWKELLSIGMPMGFAIFFETAVFAAVTLLMSNFSTTTIAAHQAALNFASTLYMVPLSICMALTILVGFEAGAGRIQDAKSYGRIGIGSATAFSIASAVILLLWSEQVAGLYSRDAEVIALIQHFLVYAIFFQLSDAIATPTQGALRGFKDVKPAFFLTFLSFWVIGLPSGYLFATFTSLGAFGYWLGLITGLAVGAVTLLLRLMLVQRRFERMDMVANQTD